RGAGATDFRFVEDLLWIGSIGAHYHLGADGISLWLVLLTTLLMPIAILSSWTAIQKRQLSYYVFLLLLAGAMIGVFVSLDLLLLAFAFAFCIKVPLFPLHTLLPDAHTEAPTAGSVILAGVLLKMGTYGLLRFNLGLFPNMSRQFAWIMITLAIIGIIYGALVAMVQPDVKRLVAYSSVSHMG